MPPRYGLSKNCSSRFRTIAAKTVWIGKSINYGKRSIAGIRLPKGNFAKPRLESRTTINSSVAILEYDPAWTALFDVEASRIRTVLGPRVLLLEHVGSTSVPRLAAKPIIDILLVVSDTRDEPAY